MVQPRKQLTTQVLINPTLADIGLPTVALYLPFAWFALAPIILIEAGYGARRPEARDDDDRRSKRAATLSSAQSNEACDGRERGGECREDEQAEAAEPEDEVHPDVRKPLLVDPSSSMAPYGQQVPVG